MSRKLDCLRCGSPMEYTRDEKIQLGQHGLIWGDISNLIAGALEVTIYTCNQCGKIEFFQMEEQVGEDQIAKMECPSCGRTHDIDYPKCPFCKYDYYAEID